MTRGKLGKLKLLASNCCARNASGAKIKLAGMLNCRFSFNEKTVDASCFVIEENKIDLLGIDWIEQLGLWNIPLNQACNPPTTISTVSTEDTLDNKLADYSSKSIRALYEKFPSIFEGDLGLCTKMKAQLFIRSGTKPVFRPKRPVPYGVVDALDKELDRLQTLGVISPVNYSAWASHMVVVKKPNGSLRVCGDFSTGLNSALEVHQYPISVAKMCYNAQKIIVAICVPKRLK